MMRERRMMSGGHDARLNAPHPEHDEGEGE